MPDAVTEALQRAVGQAKAEVLKVLSPRAKLVCLDCGAELKHPGGWMPIMRLRGQVEVACKGYEWQRLPGCGNIIQIAILDLKGEGRIEYEWSSARVRLRR